VRGDHVYGVYGVGSFVGSKREEGGGGGRFSAAHAMHLHLKWLLRSPADAPSRNRAMRDFYCFLSRFSPSFLRRPFVRLSFLPFFLPADRAAFRYHRQTTSDSLAFSLGAGDLSAVLADRWRI